MAKSPPVLFVIAVLLAGCLADGPNDETGSRGDPGDEGTSFANRTPPITDKNASELALQLNDMDAGWQRRSEGEISPREANSTSAYRTELLRPEYADPAIIETEAHVFASIKGATTFFNDNKQEVKENYSTEERSIGAEAFYFERAQPLIFLHAREGNVVWIVEFKGQAGYYWDPEIEAIGRVLVAKV